MDVIAPVLCIILLLVALAFGVWLRGKVLIPIVRWWETKKQETALYEAMSEQDALQRAAERIQKRGW